MSLLQLVTNNFPLPIVLVKVAQSLLMENQLVSLEIVRLSLMVKQSLVRMNQTIP